MPFPVKSKIRTAMLFVGFAIMLLMASSWAFFYGFGRISVAILSERFSGPVILDLLFSFQNAALTLVLVLVFFLLVALIQLDRSEKLRKKNLKLTLHWLKTLGCSEENMPKLSDNDDDLVKIMQVIESMLVRPEPVSKAPGSPEDIAEMKSRFLEIVTHQLLTPLTSVRWNIEWLLKGELGPLKSKQKELLSITEKNYESILVMINDWVEALDVERGYMRMNPEPLDIKRYIKLVVDEMMHLVEVKKIKLKVSVPRSTMLVSADKSKVIFVLKKLVHNAIVYTHEGGSLEIKVKKVGKMIRVEVKDTGVGIPYDEQHRIFNKFFRASNASLAQPNASGVGLFVAKAMIEAHGGSIWFDSEEGKGTTFFFTLPIAAVKKSVRNVARSSENKTKVTTRRFKSGRGAEKKKDLKKKK